MADEYDFEVVTGPNGKITYKKVMKPKSKPAAPTQFTTLGRAKYNAYVKKRRGETPAPIGRWMEINFPKGIVK